MAIVSAALIDALFVSFKKDFQDGLATPEPVFTKIASAIKSTSASSTYAWLGKFPKFREWIGERVVNSMKAHGYSIVNKKYETTVGVDRSDVEDDNVGVYSMIFKEAGRASAIFPDELVFDLLNKAHTTLCYDNQNFFDKEHPVFPNVDGTGTATLVHNMIEGTGDDVGPAWYLFDCGRSIKPLIYQDRIAPELTAKTDVNDQNVFNLDQYLYGVRVRGNVGVGFWQMAVRSTRILTKESFDEAYDLMRSFKSDGGRPLDLKPTILIVPATLRTKADEVVTVQRLANGADNPNFKKVEVLDSSLLTA